MPTVAEKNLDMHQLKDSKSLDALPEIQRPSGYELEHKHDDTPELPWQPMLAKDNITSALTAKQTLKGVSDLSQVFPFEIDDDSWPSVLSDHCGQSYSIQISLYKTLNLTSLNAMMTGPRAYSGPNNRSFFENDSLSFERLSRITEVLKKDVALHNTAIFVFQEVQPDFKIEGVVRNAIAALEDRMGPDWKGIQGEGGLVTLYNKQQLALEARPISSDSENPDRSLQTLFKDLETNKLVNVINIHKLHQDNNTQASIAATEAYVNGFISPRDGSSLIQQRPVTLVVGDFNLRMPSPEVYPRDNRTGIIPAFYRSNSASNYDATDACFVHDARLNDDFHQVITNELFSGFMDKDRSAHVKRLPLDPRQIAEKRQEGGTCPPIPVVFQKDHQLFSMGPRVEDIQNHFPTRNYSLRIEPSFHLDTILIETNPESKDVLMLDCNRLETKIQLMDVPFASPTPLSQFFDSIKTDVSQSKRKPIQVAAFELVSAFDEYRCLLAQPNPDEEYKRTLETRYLAAENQLKGTVFKVGADFNTKLSNALDLLCTWFTCSLITAIAGAMAGAAIGSLVGAATGSFTIPLLGSFAGAVAGAISGAIIGAGAGFIVGACTLGLKKGNEVAYRNKHAFFQDNSNQGFGKQVQDFTNACSLN